MMELNYDRCPEDDAKLILATIQMTSTGKHVTLGLAELATALCMKGSIYAATLAIKGGVENDFIGKCASGLASQMGGDIHALCPVIQILCECFALMSGGKVTTDKEGLVSVYPSRQCPKWMHEYFTQKVEDEDD